MPDGWRCPECGLILAPTITEHRCDPPTAGVHAVPSDPDRDPDLTAMGVREVQRGVASIDEIRDTLDLPPWRRLETDEPIVFTAQGPMPFSELTEAVQRRFLEQAKRNRRQPGSAA